MFIINKINALSLKEGILIVATVTFKPPKTPIRCNVIRIIVLRNS